MEGMNKYYDAGAQANVISRPTTITESLEQRKSILEQQLVRVNEALSALKANPEIERTMNLIQQASY